VIPALRAGSPARACEIGQRALEVAEGGPIEAAAALMLGTALTFNGDPRKGRALLLRAIELREQLHAEPQLSAYLGAGLRLAGEHDRARDVLAQLIANARSHGAFGLLPYALVRLADVELDTGHWPAAHAALAEAASLARETGQSADLGLAAGALAWLEAAQGRAVDCRRHAGEASPSLRLGAGSRLDRAVPALGLLALGCGELDTAIQHLLEVRKTQLEQGWCDAAVLPHRARDLIEALVRAGRAADAEREVLIFEQECRQTERPSALAALASCRGLLASPDVVDKLFRDSLAYGSDVVGPFEHARTLLAYGRRLREVGRAAEAVEHLERVHRVRPTRGGAPPAHLQSSEASVLSSDSQAGQYGTPKKPRLCESSCRREGDKAKALDMFNKGEDGFKDRDLYVFCANASDGILTAHPYLKGEHLQDIKGKKGFPLGQEIMRTATEGTINEVTYWWPRPGSDKALEKTTFYTKVGDQNCGVGYYKE
jgi:tetratricopeptide (TPR) repeat protein